MLVKGSNYLEMLSKVNTVVFDKTGTLTSGTFAVTEIKPAEGFTEQQLLDVAAHAEALSNHPIAVSVQNAYDGAIDLARVSGNEETGGHGVKAVVDGDIVLVGNDRLMYLHNVAYEAHELVGTRVHVAVNGRYAGTLIIGDTVKADSEQAVADLHREGVSQAIMLTGDAEPVARAVAERLGLDGFHAELLPQDKVQLLERIMERADGEGTLAEADSNDNGASARKRHAVAFVGDGINDAPVLTRADVGIAMGAMGSDAAIEAADVVLMDDHPTRVAQAIRLAKRTMRIVRQNIVFALGVKFAVLVLAAFGIANMWMAVFADVGVAVLAILNAMRAMHVKR